MNTEGDILRIEIRKSGKRQEDFANEMGFSRNYLLRLMERAKLPDDIKTKAAKLLKRSVQDMFSVHNANNVSEPEIAYSNAKEVSMNNIMEVPLVDQFAYAGYLSGFKQEEYIESLPTVPFIVDKQYKGNYRCFQIRGDSMDDGTDRSYKDGSIALGRELGRQHWKSKFRIDRYRFIVVHRTEGILIKQIIKHDVEKGILTLHSYNPMYEDLKAKLDKHITTHCARHTFCTNLMRNKTPSKTIISLMGWDEVSGMKQLMRYAHLVDETLKEAVDSLPEINY